MHLRSHVSHTVSLGYLWLKQVLINAFSDSSNAMLVLDGYVMAVIKKSDFLYLFDSHALNSLGIPDENRTAVVLG